MNTLEFTASQMFPSRPAAPDSLSRFHPDVKSGQAAHRPPATVRRPPSAIKQLLFVSLILLSAFSCKEEQQLPMEEDRLVRILCDVHIAEAALAKTTGAAKEAAAKKMYGQVYEIHGITEAELDSCLVQVKKSPFWLEKVYGQVMEELEKMKLEGE